MLVMFKVKIFDSVHRTCYQLNYFLNQYNYFAPSKMRYAENTIQLSLIGGLEHHFMSIIYLSVHINTPSFKHMQLTITKITLRKDTHSIDMSFWKKQKGRSSVINQQTLTTVGLYHKHICRHIQFNQTISGNNMTPDGHIPILNDYLKQRGAITLPLVG